MAGVVSCALLAGCGGAADEGGEAEGGREAPESSAPGEQGSNQAVTAADKKTREAGTAALALTVEIDMEGQKQTVEGEGVINLQDGTSSMKIGADGQQMEQRVVDKVLYQKPPEGQDAGLPDGRSWMKIDLEKLQKQNGDSGNVAPNPAESLDYLKALSDQGVKELGTEKVTGVNTTHYRVEVDVRRLAGGDAGAERQLTRQLGESVPMEVWLDDEGRLRRQQVDVTVPGAGGESGKGGSISTVLELSDFGTEVDVEAPPADDTADMTDRVAGQSPQHEDPAGPGN
ncbi:hypothetical protein [Streptomyces sp. 549]|uniref:hypothetical protein n=1 Tax=Streptomyces sp. 549 TaxID=3049076 RepID=UPI0024C245BA|nr:hypothetical protein [Streptomyces sp. 549]